MAQQVSGQKTIANAGTAERGPDVQGNTFYIKAKKANTGLVYYGNDGNDDVSSTTGFELDAKEGMVVEGPNLNIYWFDVAVSGEGYCWSRKN